MNLTGSKNQNTLRSLETQETLLKNTYQVAIMYRDILRLVPSTLMKEICDSIDPYATIVKCENPKMDSKDFFYKVILIPGGIHCHLKREMLKNLQNDSNQYNFHHASMEFLYYCTLKAFLPRKSTINLIRNYPAPLGSQESCRAHKWITLVGEKYPNVSFVWCGKVKTFITRLLKSSWGSFDPTSIIDPSPKPHHIQNHKDKVPDNNIYSFTKGSFVMVLNPISPVPVSKIVKSESYCVTIQVGRIIGWDHTTIWCQWFDSKRHMPMVCKENLGDLEWEAAISIIHGCGIIPHIHVLPYRPALPLCSHIHMQENWISFQSLTPRQNTLGSATIEELHRRSLLLYSKQQALPPAHEMKSFTNSTPSIKLGASFLQSLCNPRVNEESTYDENTIPSCNTLNQLVTKFALC